MKNTRTTGANKPNNSTEPKGNTLVKLQFVSGADKLVLKGKTILRGEEFEAGKETATKLLSSKAFKVKKLI